MSSNAEVKMLKVVALHDLSYFDHKKEPQYKRQSSQPFLLDEANARQFVAVGAVQIVGAEVAAEAAVNPVESNPGIADEAFEGGEADAAAALAGPDADADADADDFADDFADEPEKKAPAKARHTRKGR